MAGPTGIPGMRGPGGAGRANMRAKAEKPKDMKNTVVRLLKYMSQTKLALAAALLASVAGTVCNIAASYMIRPIINTYIVPKNGKGDPHGLFTAVIVMALVYVGSFLGMYIQMRLMLHVSQSALLGLRRDLFRHMQAMPVRFFDTNSNGDLMSRYTNDIDAVGEMMNNTIVQFIAGIMTLAGTLGMMIYTNFLLAVVTLVMTPVMAKAGQFLIKRSRRYYVFQQESIGKLNGYIEETITGQKIVKVFNHEQQAIESFREYNTDLRDKQIKAQFFGGIMGPVVGNLGQVNYSLTALLGGIFCVLRGFDVGGVTIFVTYARQFSRPVNELASQMNTIFSALAGAERVFKVMDGRPEPDYGEICEADETDETGRLGETDKTDKSDNVLDIKSDCEKADRNGRAAAFANAHIDRLENVRGEIEFKDVTFGYDPAKVILKNISLYARKGQKIAFVGSTGAGKTTITNLLNRFYEIQKGSISIDNIDIRRIKKDELRKNMALVLQDTHLFTGTVMENIRYGRLDASDEEVVAAAKTANADYFIRRLENGYNTMIEGDGSNLSQGQRQLLNIARAALSKAPILILDEATSSVDTRTEKQIQDAMDNLMSDRTTLVIAHRLSTIRDSDAIMVLENGEIIERGTHEQLMEQNGRYYELYTGKIQLT